MIKAIFKHNFLLIFAIFFTIPLIFLGSFFDTSKYEKILQNGIETEAEIIHDTMTSNITVNDVKYYNVSFVFLDENGEEHVGKTSSSYTLYEARMLEKVGKILIKYDPNTFDAVESSYDPYKTPEKSVITIIFVIFCGLDLLLWGLTIFIIVKRLRKHNALKNGKEYIATVTTYDSNVTINGVPKYKIHYNWVDSNGIKHNGSSSNDYSLNQATALQLQKEINIRAIGKYSAVISQPDLSLLSQQNNNDPQMENNNQNTEQEKQPKKIVTNCDYCGAQVKPTDEYCPYCQSYINRT